MNKSKIYKNKLHVLIIALVLVLSLTGCKTIVSGIDIVIPDFEQVSPEIAPKDYIATPQTVGDLRSNLLALEFCLYDWQDYAWALEDYIKQVKKTLEANSN